MESVQVSVIFSKLNSNYIRHKYLEYWMSLGEHFLRIRVECTNNLMTPVSKPVMLNGVLILLLCLPLDGEPDPDPSNPGFLFSGHLFPILFLLEFGCVRREIIERVAGSRSELILYFKPNFKRGSGN